MNCFENYTKVYENHRKSMSKIYEVFSNTYIIDYNRIYTYDIKEAASIVELPSWNQFPHHSSMPAKLALLPQTMPAFAHVEE